MIRIRVAAIALAAVALGAGPTAAHDLDGTWGGDFAARLAHGDAHLAAGEVPEAVEAYRRAAALAPSAWSAAYRIGLAHYRWAERVPARRAWALDEAAAAAAEAARLEPTAVEAWRLLGAAEHARGRPEEAYRALRRAERLRGGDPGLLCDLAVAAAATARRREAADLLARATVVGGAAEAARTAEALRLPLPPAASPSGSAAR